MLIPSLAGVKDITIKCGERNEDFKSYFNRSLDDYFPRDVLVEPLSLRSMQARAPDVIKDGFSKVQGRMPFSNKTCSLKGETV